MAKLSSNFLDWEITFRPGKQSCSLNNRKQNKNHLCQTVTASRTIIHFQAQKTLASEEWAFFGRRRKKTQLEDCHVCNNQVCYYNPVGWADIPVGEEAASLAEVSA